MDRPDLKKLYQEYNSTLFDGALPDLPVTWNGRISKTLGRCWYNRTKAGLRPKAIDIKFPYASERQMRKTLVHEMCHVWACIEKGEIAHGDWFWKKMEECGYPDGHIFPDADRSEIDIYDDARQNYSFSIGQRVEFEGAEGEAIKGKIIRINKRTVTVKVRRRRYRVPPCRLQST
jgi:hypothetical protein